MVQGSLTFLFLSLGPKRRAIEVGAKEVHVTERELVGPAAGVTGGVDGGTGIAVVTAVETQDLVSAGVNPGHPHRILGSISATVGEEDFVQPSWC